MLLLVPNPPLFHTSPDFNVNSEFILVVGSSVAPFYDTAVEACLAASAHPYRSARISASYCLRALGSVVQSKASELAHKVRQFDSDAYPCLSPASVPGAHPPVP